MKFGRIHDMTRPLCVASLLLFAIAAAGCSDSTSPGVQQASPPVVHSSASGTGGLTSSDSRMLQACMDDINLYTRLDARTNDALSLIQSRRISEAIELLHQTLWSIATRKPIPDAWRVTKGAEWRRLAGKCHCLLAICYSALHIASQANRELDEALLADPNTLPLVQKLRDLPQGARGDVAPSQESSTEMVAAGSQVSDTSGQEALSDLRVTSWSWDVSSPYERSIVGTLYNGSQRTVSPVMVQFKLLDDSGAIVGTAMDTILTLDPGETWRFKAGVWNSNATRAQFSKVDGLVQ